VSDLHIVTNWESIVDALRNYPGGFPRSELFASRIDYHTAIQTAPVINNSFLVQEGQTPMAVVISANSSGGIGYFDRPAIVEFSRGSESALPNSVLRAVGKHVAETVSSAVENRVAYQKDSNVVDALEAKLLHASFRPSLLFEAKINLQRSTQEILTSFRTGHRRDVRQGSQALGNPRIYHNEIPLHVFNSFRALHRSVSGRVTRPGRSWDLMLSAIEDGEAVLATSEIDGELVGGTFCWLSGSAAEYGTGAYSRDHFAKFAISHNLLFRSMEFAKDLGCRLFVLGDGYDFDGSDKQKAIAYFKRGFVDTVDVMSVYSFKLEGAEASLAV